MKTWDYSDTEHPNKTIVIYAALLTIATVLMVQGTISYSLAQSSSEKSIIGVFPLESKPYSSTFKDWTARWWQWDLSIPKDQNPGGDSTGRYCDQRQAGPVWFLAGTFGGPATRTCNIPSGKAILLPLINAQCNYLTKPNLKTNSQLLDCAKSLNEGITKLDATVDGVKIPGLQTIQSTVSAICDGIWS
jgi:hypothetical protein